MQTEYIDRVGLEWFYLGHFVEGCYGCMHQAFAIESPPAQQGPVFLGQNFSAPRLPQYIYSSK